MTETSNSKQKVTRMLELTRKPCPYCGGIVIICGHTSEAGEQSFSLCCGISEMMLLNYEFYEALAPKLRQVVLETEHKQLEATGEAYDERGRLRAEWVAECWKRWPKLMMGDPPNGISEPTSPLAGGRPSLAEWMKGEHSGI